MPITASGQPEPGWRVNPLKPGQDSAPKGSDRADTKAYTLAVLCLALACLAQMAAEPLWGGNHPYIFFFVAVFVAMHLGGLRLFLLAQVAAVLLADWFFLPPTHSLLIAGASNQVKTLLFFLISFLMLYFTERIRRLLRREQAAGHELAKHAEALQESQARFEHLFEHSPAPSWVEDWTALKQWLDELRRQGVVELREYLEGDPQRLRHALGLVRVLDVNAAALRLTGAASKEKLAANLAQLFTGETYRSFAKVLDALWDNRDHIEHECACQRLDGQGLDFILRVDVPRKGAGEDLHFANVIVTATDITERKKAEREREELVGRLKGALAEVKTLSGLLPICAHCKSIRDDHGYWNQIELYIGRHSNASFSHGICPECTLKLYPEFADLEQCATRE